MLNAKTVRKMQYLLNNGQLIVIRIQKVPCLSGEQTKFKMFF